MGQHITTTIGRSRIDITIIRGMIGMMTIEEMMIIEMIIIWTIVIENIRQEMTEGHAKVTNIMMIEGGMTIIDMTIVDTMMTGEMIIEDPRI